ncbi:MAG: hypothetical protein K0U59_07440 [Gammaproteobacteria bacterium]|nr:hypothetical protein [Gammaproteobacteria bacterium]
MQPMHPSHDEIQALITQSKTALKKTGHNLKKGGHNAKAAFKKASHNFNAAVAGSADEDNSFDAQTKELQDARVAILFYLAHIEMVRHADPISIKGITTSLIASSMASVLNVDIAGHLGNLTATSLKLTKQYAPTSITDAFKEASTPITGNVRQLFDKLDSVINQIFEKAVNTWYRANCPFEVDSETQTFTGRITAQHLHGKFTDLLCEKIVELTPGLDDIRDIDKVVEGSLKIASELTKWGEELFYGRGQTVLHGAPDIMQKCIRNQHICKLGEDTSNLVTGGGNLTATVFTGPAGKLALKIISIVQTVLHWFYMILQNVNTQYTLSRARREWAKWKSEEESIKATCFLNNPEEFNRWFRRGVTLSPVAGQLCLTSGFNAHPMRFLQLLDVQGDIISQKKYTRGEEYIDKLKKSAVVGVNGFCEAYRYKFTSSVPWLDALLSVTQENNGIGRISGGSITS